MFVIYCQIIVKFLFHRLVVHWRYQKAASLLLHLQQNRFRLFTAGAWTITLFTVVIIFAIVLSCKIFKYFALQVRSSNWVHKTKIHSIQGCATLAPKLVNLLSFWRSSSTPFNYWIKYSWSGLAHILYNINMSVRWNTLLRNQISSCQHIFYYSTSKRIVQCSLFKLSLIFKG